MENIEELKKELIEKLNIKYPKSTYSPQITIGEAALLKHPKKPSEKQFKRLSKLYSKSTTAPLRKVCRAIGIPYEAVYVKNKVGVTMEEGKPKLIGVNGTRVIQL